MVYVTGLTVTCVYRLTASYLATALEIALFGGTFQYDATTPPCTVQRQPPTCDDEQYQKYVKCKAIEEDYPYYKRSPNDRGPWAQAMEAARATWGSNIALGASSDSTKGPCGNRDNPDKQTGSHANVFRTNNQGKRYGEPLTAIGFCECCFMEDEKPKIRGQCGFFHRRDLE
jgi:hypothetical protein